MIFLPTPLIRLLYICLSVCVCVVWQYGGLLVHCVVRHSCVHIIFKHYTPGSAPVLLINQTRQSVIGYWQTCVHFRSQFSVVKSVWHT